MWSRTLANAQKLVKEMTTEMGHASCKFKACSTAQDAVTDADIICTATFATAPILQGQWVKPGAHINGIQC